MDFSEGLTFANKEAVKRALIIYAVKDNRNVTVSKSTKTKLMSHASGTLGHSWNLNLMVYGWSHLMWVHIIVYPLAYEETIEWWILILLHQKLFQNWDRIIVLALLSSRTSLKQSMIMSFLTIRYRMRNQRQLRRYSGIGNSLTKSCESCCWHTWIKIRVLSTSITPYPKAYLVLHHCTMYFGHSFCALMDSDIAS